MSYYGHITYRGLFSVAKQMLAANGSYRYGGSHAQIAYALADFSPVEVMLHHSGVRVINTTVDTVTVALIGINKDVPATFTDLTMVDVSDSYTVGADKYAVLLEGQLVVDGVTLDAGNDLHKLDPNTVATGNGKLLVFGFTQE